MSLPSRMISTLTNATFEVWFTWNGGAPYQRIMDFGDAPGDPPGGRSYLYLAASRGSGGPGSGFSLTGKTAFAANATETLDTGVMHHLALVIDKDSKAMTFYIDAAFQSAVAFDSSLNKIDDVLGFLGRSLFAGDPYLNGSIDELRIYNVALDASQIAYSYAQESDTFLFE